MELNDLKIFIAIIQTGSITEASKRLDYVQSNITMRLRKMEEELGTPLFLRNSKGVTPTKKGLLFHEYASEVLFKMEEAIQAVQEPDYPSGPLAIGVVETVASSGPFIHALTTFQRTYPDVALSLFTGTSSNNYAKVMNGQLDGAFATGDIDMSPLHIFYEVQEEIVLLTDSNHHAPSDFPNMEQVTWIVFAKGCPLRTTLEEWLHDHQIALTNVVEVSTLETMMNCVRAGIGYTLLTKSAFSEIDDSIHTYKIPKPYQLATTRLFSRKKQVSSQAFTAFAQCVRERGI